MVIVRIWEGLGNQLFQYAYARALSLSTNQRVFLDIRETGKLTKEKALPYREYELGNFQITLPVCTNVQHFYPYLDNPCITNIARKFSICKAIPCPYKYFSECNPIFDENLVNLKGNWYLQGWFQDERYFQKYAEMIRNEIVPKKKIRISSKLKQLLHLDNAVSVHFRRTDFKKGRNVLPKTYYYNAMRYMQNFIEKPYWIIFSDDIRWVKENIDFGDNFYFLSEAEKLKDFEELMVMSCCKNHIIANSTYSWWGAWLNKNKDKIVLGPNKWFLQQTYDTQVMPDTWIQVSIR